MLLRVLVQGRVYMLNAQSVTVQHCCDTSVVLGTGARCGEVCPSPAGTADSCTGGRGEEGHGALFE